MDETLLDQAANRRLEAQTAAGNNVSKATSEEVKAVRQELRNKDDHSATMSRSRIRKQPAQQQSKDQGWQRASRRREITIAASAKRMNKAKQASIQSFLPPAGSLTGSSLTQSSTQPEFIGVVPGGQTPNSLTDWITRHKLTVVDVPSNGNCPLELST